MIIAIDGPSGSGKSTVSKELAKKFGLACLDTGAMYRAITYRGLQEGFDLANAKDLDNDESLSDVRAALVKIANEEPIQFEFDEFGQTILVEIGGQDVTIQIRTSEVDSAVSVVSACKDIRAALLIQQREMAKQNDTILDGRDIGTVVFPNADIKVFLTASAEERARRRVAQNIEFGIDDTDYEKILELIKYRDQFDSTREIAPLTCAEDAIKIDTTDMSFDDVVEKISQLIEQHRG